MGEAIGLKGPVPVEFPTKERGAYAIAALRPLLASVSVELGSAEEQIETDSYTVTLEGIRHTYFKLKDGHPAEPGGDNEIVAACAVLYETPKLLNKVLARRNSTARIATLQELTHRSGKLRLAFVLLDDELAYLLTWSPVIHNFCRPRRPDLH